MKEYFRSNGFWFSKDETGAWQQAIICPAPDCKMPIMDEFKEITVSRIGSQRWHLPCYHAYILKFDFYKK